MNKSMHGSYGDDGHICRTCRTAQLDIYALRFIPEGCLPAHSKNGVLAFLHSLDAGLFHACLCLHGQAGMSQRTTIFLSDVETVAWADGEVEALSKKASRIIVTRGPEGAFEYNTTGMHDVGAMGSMEGGTEGDLDMLHLSRGSISGSCMRACALPAPERPCAPPALLMYCPLLLLLLLRCAPSMCQ